MKKIVLLLVIGLLFLEGYSQEKNFIDQAYLETTAIVDTLVVPDRIYLSILITEKDTRGRTSVEELENRMNAKLISFGINTKKQLTLSDVTSNFKNYFLKGTEVLKNKSYTLLVFDAETAGKVIVGLESIEISNVFLTKTEYSKLEELKIELKRKAVIKAKIQAESMLEPLNQNIGKALYLSDLNSNITNLLQGKSAGIQIRGYSSNYRAKEYQPIDIEFEKIKVESAVTIKFGIE
jgi:uncharacterized protein YggE